MKKVLEFIKKHKKAIIIIVIVAVVAFGAVKITQAIKNAKNLLAGMQDSASTAEIEERDIVNSVTATGKIVAVDKRTVSSSVTGVKVKQINVAVGDQVKAGDILCLLDGEDLEQQLADANTMLNADAGRSSLDLQASNRNLTEAVTDRDISATRGEEDKEKAYQNVQVAANECQEAKDAYDTAANETKAWKDNMDAAKRKLDEVSSPKWVSNEAGMKNAEDTYDLVLPELIHYVEAVKNDPNEGASISNDCSSLGDIATDVIPNIWEVYDGITGDVRDTIEGYLSQLKDAQTEYKIAVSDRIDKNATLRQQYEAEYQQAKANYETYLAKEESQKSLYESKAKTVESLWDTYDSVIRSIDDSKRANDSAVASRVDSVKNSQLSASTATLSDKRSVAQLQEQIDSCVVTASIDGIVTDIGVIQGDTYAGGGIVTIENTVDYEISANIDEYDIAKIKVGQEVIVKTNGTGDLEMKGQVKSIAPHATSDPSVSGVKYEVIISLLEQNPDIRLDMTAKVEIISEKSEGVLAIATEAIQEDEDGNFFVEVLDSGNPVDSAALLADGAEMSEEDLEKLQSGEKTYESHNVYITKGLVGDYYTEISGEGIEAGMKIVIPNDGAISALEEYMEESGAAGGF